MTIALVSLAVAGIPLVTTMGLMAAIAVVVAVLAALTLLPALLAITGPHINSLRVRGRHPEHDPHERSRAVGPVGARVARHPIVAGLAALAILIPLAIPLLSLNLGQKDVAALPTSTTARQAYDLISETSARGERAAAYRGSAPRQPRVARRRPARPATPRLQTLQKDVSKTKGVAAVTPVQIDKAGTTAYFNAIATTGPAEQATTDLVSTLRSSVIPAPRRAPT